MNTGGETVSRLASSLRRSVGTGPSCEDIGARGKPSGFPNFSLLPVAPSSDSRPPIAPRKRAKTRTMFAKKIKLLPDSSSEILKGAQGLSRGELLKLAKRLEMALDHGSGSGVKMQFRETGPVQQSTGRRGRKELTAYGGKVVSELRFSSRCKKDGGGNEELTDRRPLLAGNKN